MQEWFVRERADSPVVAVDFAGADDRVPGARASSTHSRPPRPCSCARRTR